MLTNQPDLLARQMLVARVTDALGRTVCHAHAQCRKASGYDAADFVEELRTLNVRPHVAQNISRRRSAIDRRTTRHAGYVATCARAILS